MIEMSANPVQWIARARSIQRALDVLEASPGHVLLILPSTRSALLLTREVCLGRECNVIAGPISSDAKWGFGSLLRTPAEIAKALAGQPELLRTVISFP